MLYFLYDFISLGFNTDVIKNFRLAGHFFQDHCYAHLSGKCFSSFKVNEVALPICKFLLPHAIN